MASFALNTIFNFEFFVKQCLINIISGSMAFQASFSFCRRSFMTYTCFDCISFSGLESFESLCVLAIFPNIQLLTLFVSLMTHSAGINTNKTVCFLLLAIRISYKNSYNKKRYER